MAFCDQSRLPFESSAAAGDLCARLVPRIPATVQGASPIAESFDFSVEKDNDVVIQALQEVALSGERVNLHFKVRYARFKWRGDTRYFVTRVERIETR